MKKIESWKIRYWIRYYRPYFEWGMNHTFPYIYIGWFLVTFYPFKIKFMPD